jgi:hypothetical protein
VLEKDDLPSGLGEKAYERRFYPRWGEQSVREKAPPLAERKEWMRRLEISPTVKDARHVVERIPWGDLMYPPWNTHGGRVAVTYCRGLAEGIITVAGAIMMNKTGCSCPIHTARMTA